MKEGERTEGRMRREAGKDGRDTFSEHNFHRADYKLTCCAAMSGGPDSAAAHMVRLRLRPSRMPRSVMVSDGLHQQLL